MIATKRQSRDHTDDAYRVAANVCDPELPMLTLGDLGILREVRRERDTVVVVITPTYTGCPAMATIRSDLQLALQDAGYDSVDIRTSLSPAWSSDWVTDHGRQVLADHGIAPPNRRDSATSDQDGPGTALTLIMPDRLVSCPQCGSSDSHELSHFSSSACRALRVCRSCGEPFEQFKQL